MIYCIYKAMESIFTGVFYVFMFLAAYVEVFLLVTFLERRKDIVSLLDDRPDSAYPSVTIIVPCWNEETTVAGTVESILALDYPKDKLNIFIVDDGSTDGTWKAIQQFKDMPNIKLVHKENGGKHTAMNLAISQATTEFVGCLDADSFVTSSALRKMMPYFDNPETMAVCPTIMVSDAKNILQKAQKTEYQLSAYIKKMLGLMGGIHVTPGPFSIYRIAVFQKVGLYHEAHKTEDMEIAYRMHEAGFKIEQCHDAIVYTKAIRTPYQLYKQRLRWIYGFLNNSIDYRRLLFKGEYGVFSLFTVPAGIISVLSTIFLFFFLVYSAISFVTQKVIKYQAVGFKLSSLAPSHVTFDWFFVNTHAIIFITILMYGFVFLSLFLGSKIATGKGKLSFGMVWYILIYTFLAPIWIMRAVYNTVMRRETAWR